MVSLSILILCSAFLSTMFRFHSNCYSLHQSLCVSQRHLGLCTLCRVVCGCALHFLCSSYEKCVPKRQIGVTISMKGKGDSSVLEQMFYMWVSQIPFNSNFSPSHESHWRSSYHVQKTCIPALKAVTSLGIHPLARSGILKQLVNGGAAEEQSGKDPGLGSWPATANPRGKC